MMKGLLVYAMAGAHMKMTFGAAFLPDVSHYTRGFRFGILLLCFGIGAGLSRRRKPSKPFWNLMATYLVAALLIAFASATYGADWAQKGGPVLPFAEQASGVLRLVYVPPLIDFLLPYAFAYGLLIAVQAIRGGRDWDLRKAVFVASVVISLLGWALSEAGIRPPILAGLWADGFRSFQTVWIFGLGMMLSGMIERYPARPFAWPVSILVLLAAVLLPNVAAQLVEPLSTAELQVKQTGHPAYVLACVFLTGLIALALNDLVLRFPRGRVLRTLETMGQRTFRCMSVQVIALPIAAVAAQLWVPLEFRAVATWAFMGGLAVVVLWPSRKLPRSLPVNERSAPEPARELTPTA